MLRELRTLYNKYQGDVEEIIPFAGMSIASALDRAGRMTKEPGSGAPELWNQDQLSRLWVMIRARKLASPKRTVRDICNELVSATWPANPDELDPFTKVGPKVKGYEVWAYEKRSIAREEVSRYITNAEQLRRRFGDADKLIRTTSGALAHFEQEARGLVDLWRRGRGPSRRGRK